MNELSAESPQSESIQPPASHPGRLALAVLLILALLLARAALRGGHSRKPAGDAVSAVVAADLQMKLSLASKALGQPSLETTARNTAAGMYLQAVQVSPSPYTLRRLGVVLGTTDPDAAMPTFAKIASPKTLRDVPKYDHTRLRREAQMWQAIYSDNRLTPAQVRDYETVIRTVSIGPARCLALERLYRCAGQPGVGRRMVERARSEYLVEFGLLMLLFLIGLAALLAGTAGLGYLAFSRPPPAERLNLTHRPSDDARLESSLWQAFVAYLAITLVVSLLGDAFVTPVVERAPVAQRTALMIASQFGAYVAAGLLSLLLLRSLFEGKGVSLASLGLNRTHAGKNAAWGVAGYACTTPILVVALFSAAALQRLLPNVPSPSNPIVPLLLSSSGLLPLAAVFILAAVMAPLFEELFFRGVLFRALRWRFGVWPAILVSAAMFAAVHPQLPAGFIPIFALGVSFAILAQARNSLIPSMIAHGINNGVLFLTIVLATRP